MATKTDQNDVLTLRKEVLRLTKVVAMLTQRLGMFEKQMRSMKARAHQTGLNIETMGRAAAERAAAPYSPPPREDGRGLIRGR